MSTNCLGCKTYFDEGEKLPLQDLIIEFKNYSYPIKQAKPKWIILKTICAFLNTKGGTLYIGVEDGNGSVIGVNINRKEQDEFKLSLKQMVERIEPSVDFTEKQEVQVYYVPVVKEKRFQGKFVIKIVVKQGDPSKLYCFSQLLTLQPNERKGKSEEYEIVYTYRRHNMGGVEEAKGIKVVQCAQRKASKPNSIANTFHEDCNPQPLSLSLELTKLAFGGLNKKSIREKFEMVFHGQLQKMKISYGMTYDMDNKVVLIQFDTPEQYQMANSFIVKHLKDLNSKDDGVQFANMGIFLDYNLYKNTKQFTKLDSGKQSRKSSSLSDPNISDNELTEAEKSEARKQYSITFTHINPKLSKQLLQELKRLAKASKFSQKMYDNSIQINFQKQEEQKSFLSTCLLEKNNLNNYGFNGMIVFGYGTGKVHIMNYNPGKRKELKSFMERLINNELEDIDFRVENNRYYLQLKLKNKPLACKWLDILLNNRQLKQNYRIPGSEKGKKPKMKIYVHCLGDKY